MANKRGLEEGSEGMHFNSTSLTLAVSKTSRPSRGDRPYPDMQSGSRDQKRNGNTGTREHGRGRGTHQRACPASPE